MSPHPAIGHSRPVRPPVGRDAGAAVPAHGPPGARAKARGGACGPDFSAGAWVTPVGTPSALLAGERSGCRERGAVLLGGQAAPPAAKR